MVAASVGASGDVLLKNWTALFPFGPSGQFRGLFFESGLYDSSGLREFIKTVFPDTAPPAGVPLRSMTMLATNMGTGEGETFSFVGSRGTPLFVDALMATTAIQGAFPMVEIDHEYYGDGGLIATIDPYNAIDTCRKLGYSSDNIKIDTISVAGFEQVVLPPGVVFVLTSEQIQQRVAVMQAIDSLMSVISFVRTAEPGMFRLNLYPSQPLPGTGLDFNQTEMSEMVVIGIADGIAAAQTLMDADELDAGAMPKTCAYKTATVACGSDKDCFNWGTQMCASQLSATVCGHETRVCTFTL